MQSALVIQDRGTEAVFGDSVANIEAFEPRCGNELLVRKPHTNGTNLPATKEMNDSSMLLKSVGGSSGNTFEFGAVTVPML